MARISRKKMGLLAASGGMLVIGLYMLSTLPGNTGNTAPVEVEVREVNIEVPVSGVEVLASTRDLIRGDVIVPTDLKWILWPEEAATDKHFDKNAFPNAFTELTGRAVLEPIFEGEPISQSRLLGVAGGTLMSTRVRQGYRAFATPISPGSGVSGFVLPDDRVDLIWSFNEQQMSETTGEMVSFQTAQHLMENVRVLSVDTVAYAQSAPGGTISGRNINVEVTPEQAEILTIAMTEGSVFYTLRSVLDSNAYDGEPQTLINPIEERYEALLPPEEGMPTAPQPPVVYRNGIPEG